MMYRDEQELRELRRQHEQRIQFYFYYYIHIDLIFLLVALAANNAYSTVGCVAPVGYENFIGRGFALSSSRPRKSSAAEGAWILGFAGRDAGAQA